MDIMMGEERGSPWPVSPLCLWRKCFSYPCHYPQNIPSQVVRHTYLTNTIWCSLLFYPTVFWGVREHLRATREEQAAGSERTPLLRSQEDAA